MKENKIEKLILDLSNRWDCTPQEAVDRLNSMNESEINKLINSMTKKFKNGGLIECLRNGNKIADCKCGDKIGVKKAKKGSVMDENPQLPKYAKIIEGGGRYNNPRRVYYAYNRADLSRMPHNPKDGDIFSEELSIDPTVYWSNEIGKHAQSFGMNYPVRPTVYSDPYYLRYIQHDNSGLNIQTADEIDPDKAKIETSNKIRTIRNQQNGGVVKAEDGISMGQVRQAVRDNGLQGHNAYANMKLALRNQGLRGRELRQTARRNIVESVYPRAVEETPSIEAVSSNVSDAPIVRQENASNFSRMDALNMLRTTGSTNRESRQEYRVAKRDARATGLRGNEMRQAARSSIMERGANRILPALDDGSGLTIEDPIIELNDSFQTLNYEQPVVQPMQYQSFGDAFANARKKGLDKFYWTDPTGKNSGWKTTELKPTEPTETTNLPGASGPNPTHTGGTVNTPGWIAGPGYQPGIWRTAISYLKNRK